ncbi:hypothetical protein FPK78_24380, partial [Acinetobacter baumannii]|nr:hypothetical protein [Acinetobacter baumannii]
MTVTNTHGPFLAETATLASLSIETDAGFASMVGSVAGSNHGDGENESGTVVWATGIETGIEVLG